MIFMKFAPAIQRGIFLTVDESGKGSNFVVVAAMRNPRDEDVKLRTMSTKLFSVQMKQRTFTEEGDEHLWMPSTVAGQAVTHRTLKANKTVVQKWKITNAYEAYEKAVETCEEDDFFEDEDLTAWTQHYSPVEPSRVGVVKVEVGFPAPDSYYNNLTRQYDLRTRPDRELDDELPEGDENAIESQI
jgi:hypothetical protein